VDFGAGVEVFLMVLAGLLIRAGAAGVLGCGHVENRHQLRASLRLAWRKAALTAAG
jgi:hypothetical protein